MKLLILLLTLISCTHLKEHSSELRFDSELSGYDYPYPVHFFQFNSQNQKMKMAYMDISPENPKGTYVLFHGKNFSGYYFKDFIEYFKSQDFRVIVVDQVDRKSVV